MASSPLTKQRWFSRRIPGWSYLSLLPHRRLLSLYFAIFFLFAIMGFHMDLTIADGAAPVWLVLAFALLTGTYAVLYPYALIHKPVLWLYIIAFLNFFLGPVIGTWFGHLFVLHRAHFARPAVGIHFAAHGVLIAIFASYVCFVWFIRDQASSALRIQNELDLAHGIQRTLVPPIDLAVGGYELHGASLPSDKVGGDLVDTVEVSNGFVAYVADVAGHGLQAGILMGMIKIAARTILLEEFEDPAELLQAFCSRLNRVLPGVKEAHMYATLAVLHLAHDGHVHYALAGHPAILHYTASGRTVSRLCCEQFPVGLLPVGAFLTQETILHPGDMLVVSTDGILEACNAQEEEFGTERLAALAQQYVGSPDLGTLSRKITTSVQAFGKQTDDQTLLLIRRTATTGFRPSSAEREERIVALA